MEPCLVVPIVVQFVLSLPLFMCCVWGVIGCGTMKMCGGAAGVNLRSAAACEGIELALRAG